MKKKILLFADWYEPGFKAGGPIRSCVNFVRNMQSDYEVYVFTGDRDLGSEEPYEQIKPDEWVATKEGAHVYYCSPGMLNRRNIQMQMTVINPDFVYINSMFSLKFALYPLLISRLGKRKATIILAPRGMLKESALQFKPLKKKIFLKAFRLLGLQRGIRFHAGDDTEVKDARHHFGSHAHVTLIPNFPAALAAEPLGLDKRPGELSMIFVGRIHPIKNLDYLLGLLSEVSARVRLTVVGSLEDKPFWRNCLAIIAGLPDHIRVEYAGEKPNHQLPGIIAGHHIFVLPTKGENFGHAIFEAMAAGRPVLISDQTPWRNLEAARAGWDLPLGQPDLFRQAIGQAACFDQEEFDEWRRSARQFVQAFIAGSDLKKDYLNLFA